MPMPRYILRMRNAPAVREEIHIISHDNEVGVYRIYKVNISHRLTAIYRRKEIDMSEKSIKELAVELTVEITELCDLIKAKTIYTNQLLRSCSSIGANAHEAKYAHSRADFISKLEISLKEYYETEYWLELLQDTGYVTENAGGSLFADCHELYQMITAILKTAKVNMD